MRIELDALRRTHKETKKYQVRYSQENEDLQSSLNFLVNIVIEQLSEKEVLLKNSKTEVKDLSQQLQQIRAIDRPSSPKTVGRLSFSASYERQDDEATKV